MDTVKTILMYYVSISLIVSGVIAIILALHDLYAIFINPKAKDPKMGYHFGRSGLGKILVIACLPPVNLFAAYLIFTHRRKKKTP